MRESFDEYKKTIESNISNISFLYNGDVLSSINSSYSQFRTSQNTSPSFIISTIENIYNESFKMMHDKSETIIISKESINYINEMVYLDINPGGNFNPLKRNQLYI